MTTLDDIQDLAAHLHTLRDDWDLIPTLNYLLPHRHIADADLWAAATAWARNPKNRTPASLQYLTIEPNRPPERSSSPRKSNQPDVCVCGERHERRPMVIDDPPVDSPERTTAKARARAAVDQARQKSKWKPKPEPDTRRVQEPWPEETPADA